MNRSTEQWVRYIATRYPSPLVGLAEIWSRPVAELAGELELYQRGADGKPILDLDGKPRLNLMEAFKAQTGAMVAALPYLHSKMPQAVSVETRSRGLLVIGELPSGGGDDVLTLNIADYEDNQALAEASEEKSDEEQVGR